MGGESFHLTISFHSMQNCAFSNTERALITMEGALGGGGGAEHEGARGWRLGAGQKGCQLVVIVSVLLPRLLYAAPMLLAYG